MKTSASRNLFLEDINNYFLLGLKFGIVGSVIGFFSHAIWGNLDEVIFTIVTGFCIGFLIGIIEIIFTRPKILSLPYSLLLFIRTLIYFTISLACVYYILVIYLKMKGLTTEVLMNPQQFKELSDIYFLTNVNILYIMLFTMIATFFWQLKNFFGKGVITSYLIGRYHKPRIEKRILMFLDLNDATAIAEKLGSKEYSSLLRDFFKDIDSAITRTKGTVFQYVGDEVVVIWKMKDGLKKNNCLNMFYFAEKFLNTKKEYYLKRYDIFPTFKASLHSGEITITEIGVSKKEIVYHGDTMNTTSRICALCNGSDRNLLVSADLLAQLEEIDTEFEVESIGLSNLKGKKNIIGLFSIKKKSN